MTEWLLALVPAYGLWLVAATTFLSCLALPFPASIIMMTAGGFVAAGDLGMVQTFGAAALGGVLGDQAGFWVGRLMGMPLVQHLGKDPARAHLLASATAVISRRGVTAVFLSRWLFSPLGPWVNLTAGSAGYSWRLFSLSAVAGEAAWAGLYVGMGYVFAGNITAASDLLGSALGFLAAGAVMVILGMLLRSLR